MSGRKRSLRGDHPEKGSFPPGNRLEPLSGDRHGQHSIRVNDQFRLVFVWTPAGPTDVAFVDYH